MSRWIESEADAIAEMKQRLSKEISENAPYPGINFLKNYN